MITFDRENLSNRLNARHREIRDQLTRMSPHRAEAWVRSFDLPEDEERAILLREVRRWMYPKICAEMGVSTETLKRTRRRAFSKIADELEIEYHAFDPKQ